MSILSEKHRTAHLLPQNHTDRLLLLLFLLMIQPLCTSCSVIKIVDILGPDAQILREGEKQFALANYDQAAKLFKEVETSDVTPQIKNAALYSLACTRIVISKDDDQFIKAVELLDKWKKSYEGGLYIENPSLIITALEKHVNSIREKRTAVRQQTEKNNKVISMLKEKISTMKSILQTLQHQITELEAIDQQLQEKKKPL